MREIIFLPKEKILKIQARAIDKDGGLHGLRDEAGLESAISAPENYQYYGGADIVGCAAAYLYHLNQAHAFIDGNKRVAVGAMLVFLIVNDAQINATTDQLYELTLTVADGCLEREQVEEILRQWIVAEGSVQA